MGEAVLQTADGFEGGLEVSAFVALEDRHVFGVACYEVPRYCVLEVCFVCGSRGVYEVDYFGGAGCSGDEGFCEGFKGFEVA